MVDTYVYDTWEWGPSFWLIKGAHDEAPANPHYLFHSEALSGGTYYDPSYGTTGLISFSEAAPAHPPDAAATRRTGSALPARPQSEHKVLWPCPH